MNKVFCTFITKNTREQAQRLNMKPEVVNNIISTLKSIANNANLQVSDDDIKGYIEKTKRDSSLIELDLPYVDKNTGIFELTANTPVVTTMNGRFKIGKFNDKVKASSWFNTAYKSPTMIKEAKVFDSPKAIYTFNLYLAKDLFENNEDITKLDEKTRNEYLDRAFDKLKRAKELFKAEFTPKINTLEVNDNGGSINISYKIVPTLGSALASTNAKNEISVRSDITTEEIRHYLNGDIESDTSKQKKAVLQALVDKGYNKDEIFKAMGDKENITKLLLMHEYSHIKHNDKMSYWKKGKDLMTLDKIAMETRATEDALNSIGIFPNENNKKIEVQGIDFIISKSRNYRDRTKENADWSNITLALAEDFNTAGERLTRTVAGGKYVSANISNEVNTIVDSLYKQITEKGKTKDIKLNIAGNGIHSLSLTQSQYDAKLVDIIKGLQAKGITISEIRSGGQTGIDEAGAKAGQFLNIKTTINGTSNWAFRVKDGHDIYDEKAFKKRFMRTNSYVNHYTGNITNDGNTIFVFGSNPEGIHGTGAAKVAREQFGAHYGQGAGIQGNSYALPTKDLKVKANNGFRSISPKDIIANIQKLYETAKNITSKQFKIAYRTKMNQMDLSGYTGEEMVSFFKAAGEMPRNVQISEEWAKYWNDVKPYDVSKDTTKIQGPVQIDINKEDNDDIPYIDAEANVVIDTESPYVQIARVFNPTEYRDRVDAIARKFSNTLDSMYDDLIDSYNNRIASAETEDERRELESKLSIIKDVNGRKQAIIEIGFKNIADEIKSEYSDILDYNDEEIREAYNTDPNIIREKVQNTLDYFEYLLEDACNYIEMNEGIRVVIDHNTFTDGDGNTEVMNGTIENSEEEDNDEKDQTGDNENGEAVSGNDGWSFKVREVDPHTSISKETKAILRDIKKIRPDGTVDVDDLGDTRYVREDVAHATLINALSDMIDPDDFSKLDNGTYRLYALERIAQKYPWVNQVIDKLQDNPRLMSLFYTDFRKDFIPYWTQKFNTSKGIYESIPLNEAVAVDSTMNDVIRNYEGKDMMSNDSIYDSNGKIVEANCEKGIKLVDSSFKLIQDFDEDNLDTIYDNLTKTLRMIGFNTNVKDISYLYDGVNGKNNLISIIRNVKEIFNKAKDLGDNDHLIDSLKEQYTNLAELVGSVSELDNIQSFRQNGKTYYSYSAPNYINTQLKTFLNDEKRQEYIDREFKAYDWFYDKKNKTWRNEWLNLIENDADIRQHLKIKEINTLDDTGYVDWKPNQIKTAFINEYFSIPENKGSKRQYAYYNFPIFSDSPVSMFIRFIKYIDDNEGTFEDKLLLLFTNIVKQEIQRIKLCEARNADSGIMKIQNFDKRGLLFNFFPELNTNKYYTDGENLYTSKEVKNTDGLNELSFKEALNAVANDESILDNFIHRAISEIMDDNFEEFLKSYNNDSLISQMKDLDVATTDEAAMRKLKEYFWNQNFATSQIIQLTTTDLAYYKDGTDFQKRFKEAYAAGSKLNTNSKYGRKIERTIYIKDNIITSTSYTNIKANIEKAINERRLSREDGLAIISKFKDINQTDAQAYRSLSSYRAVLDMMGLWTDDMQRAFQNLQNGTYDYRDFDIVWQTIKPFVFTQIDKNDGLGGHVKVPHQNKNSEFLLLAAYDILNNVMNKSPKFRGLNEFMEKNNIDVVQFESAVKAGGEGIIDINVSQDKVNKVIEDQAITLGKGKNNITIPLQGVKNWDDIKKAFDSALDAGSISQEDYNTIMQYFEPTAEEVQKILEDYTRQPVLTKDVMKDGYNTSTVHEIPYKDYVIQTPTPEHLFDASSIYGSQYRNLLLSDMPDTMEIKLSGKVFKANNNGKNEIREFYNALIIENLLEDFNKVKEYFNSIQDLQKELLTMVKGNPKYGRDMLNALQIVKRNINGHEVETFNLPLHNPSTTTKLQELVNSIFKNHITKQKIKGGKATLASNFGFRNDLKILREEDGSIIGAECYLPFYTKKYFEQALVDVTDKNGKVIGQKLDINKIDKNLRKLLGFRIPTEAHYSMLPMIIKGFLPQQNGSSIMLPAEITQIAGEDFDIDGRFLFLPESKLEHYDYKKAFIDYKKTHSVNSGSSLAEADKNGVLSSLLEQMQKDAPVEEETFKEWFNANKEDYKLEKPKLKKVRYNMNKSPKENSRAARNNMLIDLGYAVLSAKETAEKINSPGNFDKAKAEARRADILNDEQLLSDYMKDKGISKLSEVSDKLLNENLDYLNEFIKKYKKELNPLSVDTFIYYHHQNTTGGKLIGIYANNNTAHAKFQATKLGVKPEFQFTIDGQTFSSLSEKTINRNGINESILSNCAQLSAASVDNVKDPILAKLLQNENTASIGGTMLAIGMSLKQMGLLTTQPIIRRFIELGMGINNINMLEATLNSYKKDYHIITHQLTSDTTSKELMDNILYYNKLNWDDINPDNITNYEVEGVDTKTILKNNVEAAEKFLNIMKIAKDYGDLIRISRADSPNGAMKRNIAMVTNQLHNVDAFKLRENESDFTLSNTEDCVANNVISLNDSTDEMRRKLNSRPMSMLQAFHSLGIDLGSSLESKVFMQLSPNVKAMVSQLYKNSAYNSLTDKLLDKFYADLTKFALSKTNIFGNDGTRTFDEKRDYYLYKFPKKFLEFKLNPKNKEITNLGIMKKLSIKKGKIVMDRSGNMTGALREMYMRDFENLLYMDNPNAKQLATDLLSYSFYLDGFNFGPNSFGNFFSTVFLNNFPEVINALTDMESNINTSMYADYMNQFYANYWEETGLLPKFMVRGTYTKGNNDEILVPKKVCHNKNTTSDDEFYPMMILTESNPITGDEEHTLLGYDETFDSNKFKRYYEVKVHNPNQGVKYNANMTYQEMAEVETDPKLIEDNKALDINNIEIIGKTNEAETGVNVKGNNEAPIQVERNTLRIERFINEGENNTKEIKC